MKSKNVLICMIIFMLMFNFIYVSYSYATTLVASKSVYVFIKALIASGVTSYAGVSLYQLTEDVVELSEDFYAWLDSLPTYQQPQKPPDEPGRDWQDLFILGSLGLAGIAIYDTLISLICSYLDGIGLEESNDILYTQLLPGRRIRLFDYSEEGISNDLNDVSESFSYPYQGKYINYYAGWQRPAYGSPAGHYFIPPRVPRIWRNYIEYIWFPIFNGNRLAYGYYSGKDYNIVNISDSLVISDYLSDTPNGNSVDSDTKEMDLVSNNYYNNRLPENIVPTGFDYNNIKDGLIINNQDEIEYRGSLEDLVDNIVDNSNPDYFLTDKPNDMSLVDGKIIINDDIDIDNIPVELPFPEPDDTPIEDSSEFQGQHIGLMQSIINWLSKILQAIQGLPQNISDNVKTVLEDLFIPDPNYLQTKIGDINTSIHTKLGGSDNVPIQNYFNGLTCLPIPDGFYKDEKIFDASYINNLAVTIQSWQRWFWYILFALMNINNTYKLIRGTDLIHLGQYSGGGGGGIDVYRGGK